MDHINIFTTPCDCGRCIYCLKAQVIKLEADNYELQEYINEILA